MIENPIELISVDPHFPIVPASKPLARQGRDALLRTTLCYGGLIIIQTFNHFEYIQLPKNKGGSQPGESQVNF